MQRYILISLVRAMLTLLGVSVIVFALARGSGNALDVMLPDTATAADRAAVAAFWGLDKPLHEQYLVFLANAVRGDFGRSFKWQGESAMGLILQRLPATLQIAIPAMVLSVAVALPLGVISAVRKDTIFDTGGKMIALLGQSLPSFWIAIVLIWILACSSGSADQRHRHVQHMVLPVIVTSLFGLAAFVRLLRSSMLEVLHTEYIKLARLKGLHEWKVIWKHALKNAAIPPLTFFGLVLVNLFTGSVVVETMFAWPGVGLLALEATNARDYQVIQAVTMGRGAVHLHQSRGGPAVRLGRSAGAALSGSRWPPRQERQRLRLRGRSPSASNADRLAQLRRLPVLPVLVLFIVLVLPAVAAELLAPHDPSRAASQSVQAAVLDGRRLDREPARHGPAGPRRAVAHHLRLTDLAGGVDERRDAGRRRRHGGRPGRRLLRRLGGPCHDVRGGHLLEPAADPDGAGAGAF